MLLAEPMTVATDGLLAAVAVVLALRLLRPRPGPGVRLMAAGFLALAGAALLGGAVHGFGPRLSLGARATAWALIYAGIGLANLLLLAGVVVALVPPRFRTLVLGALSLRFVAATILSMGRGFTFVMGDIVLSLVLLLGLGLFFTLARPRPFGPWLLLAVVASFLGAFVQVSRLSPHPDFNHNDLFHVIQMGGIYFFYRAALFLDGQPLTRKRPAD